MTPSEHCESTPPARHIYGDGDTYILAATEEDARAYAEGEGYELIREAGWMMETGWDADNYESREEFERESDFTTWWSGVQNPQGTITKHLLRAWTARAV